MALHLSRSELAEIQSLVAPKQKQTSLLARKAELQKLSKSRVEKWPNTLAHRRKMKEQARSVRLAKLEADRRENDKTLARERALDRQQRIQRANRMIYERTDRMKVLRSRRMLADILKHRKKQISQKKRFTDMESELDKLWHAESVRQMAEYDEREEAALAARKAKEQEIAAVQTQQLEEYKDRYIQQLIGEREEGERIAEECVQQMKEDREKEIAIRRREKQNMIDTMAGNEELKKIRAKFAEKEALEDASIAKYARDKEERTRQRRDREKEQFDRAQRKRQQIIDAAVAQLEAFTSHEDARLASQQAEFKAKEEARAADKAEKQRLMREAIDQSRSIQMEMRRKQKEKDDAQLEEMSRRWKLRNQQLEEEERRERRETYNRNKAHQAFLLKQAADKRSKREEEREAALRDAHFSAKVNAQDEGEIGRAHV